MVAKSKKVKKKVKDPNLMTMLAYARSIGVTHPAIIKAVKEGRIAKGWNKKEKKIIKDIADKEYGELAMARQKKVSVSQEHLEDLSNVTVEEVVVNADDDIAEADRKKTIIKAQLDLLKLKKEAGELVNRDAMYNEMFEFGKEIRTNLQSIPDRIIDQLLGMERNEAHGLLLRSINEALEKLSEDKEVVE